MHYDLRVVNGTVVSSSQQTPMDIGVIGGKIVALGDLGQDSSEETLDARDLYVLPGILDTQVHFREPGLEHKEDLESGTRAAIMGGVTTIFEMPNTNPLTITAETLQGKLDRANGRAWCDYSFFVGAATDNIENLGALEMLPGTPGVKIFMGSSTGTLLVSEDEDLRRVLLNGVRRCPIHAEDEPRLRERKALVEGGAHVREHFVWRDTESAVKATNRILALSAETRRPVHILHISTAEELPILEKAKRAGLNTTCEVTPQHLTLNEEAYESLGTYAQMNPPIRTERDRQALWRAVQAGLFDVFGSDHAPHTKDEKAKPYPQSPSGMPGVQTLVPVLLTAVEQGMISIERFVAMACENPALIYGVKGKGFIREGYDADLVVVDRRSTYSIQEKWLQSKCGWSPFMGSEVNGMPIHTVLRGRVVVRDMELQGSPGGAMVGFDWK